MLTIILVIAIASILLFIIYNYISLDFREINNEFPRELQVNNNKDILLKILYNLLNIRVVTTIASYFSDTIDNMVWYFPDSTKIALTIDDCPGMPPEKFSSLLDILKSRNIKATFMIIGDRVEGREDILVKLINDGHELGNHQKTNKNYKNSTLNEFIDDLEFTQRKIDELYNTAEKTQLIKIYRAPKGPFGINNEQQEILKERNYIHVMGDLHSNDYGFRKDIDYHYNYLVNNIKSGSIIIMHADHSDILYTTNLILEKIPFNNYTITTVSELLNDENPAIECDSEAAQDPSVCNGAGKICKINKNKSEEECGTCSDPSLSDKTSCEVAKKNWNSQMSSCYWVSPYPTGVTDSPSPACVYDLDKCDCSTFEATNQFNECCPIPNNWKNCSIKDDLDKLEDDLKDGEITTKKLGDLYKHKMDASDECSRRGELDLGYYS